MKKSEIKQGVKSIIDAVNTCLDNVDEILNPYESIKGHLEAIQEIQDNEGVDTGLDIEVVLADTLRSCVENSGDIEEMKNNFEYLISDLENWMEDVSETKQESIQEQYIDVLNEIVDSFEIDSMECREDLESQLDDIKTALEEIII